MAARRVCYRCGRVFEPGGLAYRVRVEMVTDFDGYLNADGLGPSVSVEDAAFEAMTAAASRSAEELSEEIYRERTLLLCQPCAERTWGELTVLNAPHRE